MRDALGVDVPRGVADAVGVEGGGVLVGVLRRGRAGGVRGVDAGVVLAGEDQRVGPAVGGHGVGEVLALDVATVAASGEPHLHRVTGPGARHLPPQFGVVAVTLVAVALAALPLADVGALGAAAVHPVLEALVVLVAAGGHGDRLRVAVGHVEAVDHELGRLASGDGDRVGRVGGRAGGGQGERDVLAELGLDECLVVGEEEGIGAAGRLPGIGGIGRRHRLARAHLHEHAERAVREVGVLVEDAVAGVQVRRQTAPVAGNGGGGVVARDRLVQGVVGRGRGDLPVRAVEHGLGCRVVVDEELEADPRHEAVEGLGLGFGGGTGSSIGLAATVR